MPRGKKKTNNVDPRLMYIAIIAAMLLGGFVHVMYKLSNTTTSQYESAIPVEAVMGVQDGE